MPIVDAQGLQRAYGAHTVLTAVDATIRTGERIGLVGSNGAGKSTLARILAGVETPDAGQVHYRRGAKVAYLAQVPDLDAQATALSVVLSGRAAWMDARVRHDAASQALAADGAPERLNALLAEQARAAADLERLGGWEVGHQAEALLAHVGISRPDQRVGDMSGGEQRRVALAQLLMSAPDLAILDEPTNHLDVETIEWLERYLVGQFVGALLLITHDRYVLDRVVQRTWEIERGQLFSYAGGYASYLEGKAEREAHAERVEKNRQNFLRRELEWLRRSPKARTTKQKARIERAETAIGAPRPEQKAELSLSLAEARSGKTVLELRALTVDLAGRRLIDGLDLIVSKGERLGIVGRNGTGKTTLLRTILGELAPTSGELVLGKNVELAYLSQARDLLEPDKSVIENVAGGRLRIEYGGTDIDARGYLQRFFFYGQAQQQPVGALSGGERTRVALAKLLCREANLLVLDEPTNDLDVDTLFALEEMLLEFGGSALVVTHDRYFLDRIASGLLVADGRGHWLRYAGNYRDYLAQKALEKSEDRPAPAREKKSSDGSDKASRERTRATKRGLTYAERLELEALPDQLDAAEKRARELEAALADPALYRERGDEVAPLRAELEAANAEVERLMARWEDLETRASD